MGSTPGTDAHGHPHGSTHNDEVAHERSDISIRGVIWFVVVLTVLAVIIHVGMVGLFKLLNHEEVKNDPVVSPLAAPGGSLPPAVPEPRLQTTPWVDLKQFRTDEDAVLNSYGWVDQKGGVARLPIDKAKALLLQRGVASRAGQAGDPKEGTHAFAFGESNGGSTIPAGTADLSSPPAAAPPNAMAPAPATRVPATPGPKGPGGGAPKVGGDL